MKINFLCKTNKDYVMINTLKIQLNSGSVLTLDRHNTEYSISDSNKSGEYLLNMKWTNCYLWAIDEENLWCDDEALIEEDCEKLFEGAKFIELELEDNADEDYYVSIELLLIDGANINLANDTRVSLTEKSMTDEEIHKMIDSLSPYEQDRIYRYLWGQHVREDVISHAESIDVELDDEVIDIIVDRYVEQGDYDCNLNYWTNIENLIEEEGRIE